MTLGAVSAVIAGCTGDDGPAADGGAAVVALDGRPSAVAVGGGSVWIADDLRGVVVRLDEVSGEVEGEPSPVGGQPVALTVAEDVVWVADADGSVRRLEASTGEAIGEPLEIGGTLVDVVGAGTVVWLADIAGSRVIELDTATGVPLREVVVPEGVVRLALSPERLWVTNLDRTVTPVDLATAAAGDPIEVGEGPIGVAVAGGSVWVANSDDDTVSRLDEVTGAAVGDAVPVGRAPIGLAEDGAGLWVLEQDGRSASRLDAGTGRVVLASLDVGSRPRGLAGSTDRGVWVAGVDPSAALHLRG